MKTTRMTLGLTGLCLAVMALAGTPAAVAGGPIEIELVAGQTEVIGTVTATDDGTDLTVTYEVTATGWALTKTHLYVGAEPPKKASPGKFPYSTTHNPPVTTVTYTVPLPAGDCLFVAAHADAQSGDNCHGGDIEALCASLPATAQAVVVFPGTGFGIPSYFDITVSAGGWLDGIYDGGCIDTDRTITPGVLYDVQVFCSYDPLLPNLVEKPENLDLVNWIVNQDYPGQTSPGGYGTYTYGDVQRALWDLVDDQSAAAGLGPWDPNRVEEIKAAAAANGEGYVPGCDERVVVILNPVNILGETIRQILYIALPILCDCDEDTAWALGGPSATAFRTGWGEYFEYCPCP